jgi:FkbM family methyltransferase
MGRIKKFIFDSLSWVSTLIYHIQQLGMKDGLLVFRWDSTKEGVKSIQLKGMSHPVFLRGGGSDFEVFKQVYLYKFYNTEFNFEPEVIFDCGANIGLTTVYLKSKYPNSKIIAVEPEPSNVEMLRMNTQHLKGVEIEAKGLWGRDCFLEIEKGNDGMAWSFRVKEIDTFKEGAIPAISIPKLIEKYNLDKIDILKIDIEGSEENVFQEDPGSWISKVNVLIIELHDWQRPLSSKPFFKIFTDYNFNYSHNGENIVATQVFNP